jgi:hypothetical protein
MGCELGEQSRQFVARPWPADLVEIVRQVDNGDAAQAEAEDWNGPRQHHPGLAQAPLRRQRREEGAYSLATRLVERFAGELADGIDQPSVRFGLRVRLAEAAAGEIEVGSE